MKGQWLEPIQDMQAAMRAHLKTLTKEDVQNCYSKSQTGWDRCVQSQGQYFYGSVPLSPINFFFKHAPYFYTISHISMVTCWSGSQELWEDSALQ